MASSNPSNWPYGPYVVAQPERSIDPENPVIEVCMANGDRFYGKGWMPAVVIRAYFNRFKRRAKLK